MPSAALKQHLEELITGKLDKFEDTFDVEWNLFSTLCLRRTERCLEKKTETETLHFRGFFMNSCKTKSEKIAFLLQDKVFIDDLEDLFQNLLKDSGSSKENRKSAAVARFSFNQAKSQKVENWEKALAKFNTVGLLVRPVEFQIQKFRFSPNHSLSSPGTDVLPVLEGPRQSVGDPALCQDSAEALRAVLSEPEDRRWSPGLRGSARPAEEPQRR